MGTVTTLGSQAPFGSAVGGTTFGTGVSTLGATGFGVNSGTAGSVTTVQGAPIYVPQPYPAYYGVGVPALRGVAGAALPFGLGLHIGNEFGLSGRVASAKPGGPSLGGGGEAGPIDEITYNDAFGDLRTIGGSAEYDVSRDTTVFGTAKYGEASGRSVDTGSFTAGVYDASGNFVPAQNSPTRDLTGTFSDLETITLEAGARKYVGYNTGFRPYVGGTVGATYNDDVTLTQIDQNGALFNERVFIDNGWKPTASAILGTEFAVGHRGAIGIESGIRWTDNIGVEDKSSSDRWSIPLKLRGRVAF